ncbi:MAG: CotH kinase family protein [Calditrichae bacterium]|nr:CotH kinase family protein [Calditrichia bacterium]
MNKNVVLFLILFSMNVSVYSQTFTSSNLPIIIINTGGQNIPDEPKISAAMGIIYNGPDVRNNLSDPHNNYNGNIGIERRGSSSQSFEKKSYALETRLEDGSNNNVELLGLAEENDWVLNGPYSDKSLIRNALTFYLFNKMGRYSSRFRFCELVLNGEYQGIYVLLEKIKRDKNRVDISNLKPEDIAGDELTGGYILKIDKTQGEEVDGWYSQYRPPWASNQRIYIQYHEPAPSDLMPEQKAYIRTYINNFEDMLKSDDFADPLTGYPQWIDVGSFIDFFLINELSRNVDGYRLSSFFYKDKDSVNPKITMGPLWDFNLAFGNADYYDGSSISGLFIDYDLVDYDSFHIPFWWRRLMEDPAYVNQAVNRWNDLRSNILSPDSLNYYIDSFANELDEAQKRNFQRWDILGQYVWPNNFIGGSYGAEINYLKSWIAQRSTWLDNYFNTVLSFENQENEQKPISHFELVSIAPNPFNPVTTLTMNIAKAGIVKVNVFDVKGRLCSVLKDRNYLPGTYRFTWNAAANPSGVYFIEMQAGQFRTVQKAILLK